jgi:hypothetical protein
MKMLEAPYRAYHRKMERRSIKVQEPGGIPKKPRSEVGTYLDIVGPCEK